MLEHGGRLRRAAQHYDIPLDRWLDLSTGINPHGWPVPSLPAETWSRLPEEDDGFSEVASVYYGTTSLLPIAGSQAAIQSLPRLRRSCRVGVLSPAYAEHAHCWQSAGHEVLPLAASQVEERLPELDILVLVNPNNPTGELFERECLLAWREQLAARGGWLVVDEAFMDVTPGQSLASEAGLPGLVVLRSLGKFFGLAGARVGFVLAWKSLLQQMREVLGPWTISAPARWIAQQALADETWQQSTRQKLLSDSERLRVLLSEHGLTPRGGTALFQWVVTAQAAAWRETLAREAILVRDFAQPASLRFGLPGDEAAWERLTAVLAMAQREVA